MRAHMRRTGLVAAAAAAGFALAACDEGGLTGPAVPGEAGFGQPTAQAAAPLKVLGRRPSVGAELGPMGWGDDEDDGRVTRWIGPEGGSLEVRGVELTVPRGALDRFRRITVTVPDGDVVQVHLRPHGLQFAKGAELWFDLDGTDAEDDPELVASLVGVYFIRPIRNGLVVPEEIVPLRVEDDHIVLTIEHFSGYTPAGG